jgi:CheY-like chemotaxis protein
MNPKIPLDVLTGWTVVIVDDEPDNLEVARFLLDFYGAIVHTAANGKEGLEMIQQIKPRFVISDLSMPVLDGWGMIKQMKEDANIREIPVIALTAHAMLGDREKAIAAGFQNYITKPLNASTFIEQLIKLLIGIPEFGKEIKVEL